MSADSQVSPVLGVLISLLGLSTIFITLRIYTRLFVKKGTRGWDDVLIVFTWIIVIASNICIFIAAHYGYGHDSQEIPITNFTRVTKLELVGQALATGAMPLAEASVAISLVHAFPSRPLRYVLWTMISLNAMIYSISVILLFVECSPSAKAWNSTPPGKCWNPRIVRGLGMTSGALGGASDIMLTAVLWYLVRNLHMSSHERTGLGVAITLGFFASASAFIKTHHLSRLTSNPISFHTTIPILLWTYAEVHAIVIAACIVTLHLLLPSLPLSTTQPKPAMTSTSSPSFTPLTHNKQLYHVEINASHDRKGSSSTRSLLRSVKKVPLDGQILVEQSFMVEHAEDLNDSGDGGPSRGTDWSGRRIKGGSVDFCAAEAQAVEHV